MTNEGGEVIPFPEPPSEDFEEFIRDMMHKAVEGRTPEEKEKFKASVEAAKHRHPSAHTKEKI